MMPKVLNKRANKKINSTVSWVNPGGNVGKN